MNHLFDDALNAAWNDLATGNDSGVSAGIDPAAAALLRSMHNTAAGIEPDPAFREQLWVDLSRRPAIHAPAPESTPSLPVSAAHQMEDAAMTPCLGTTSRRWSPPIATIAAALVIILVGYGALSLSGASPSGLHLDLNEVPNASAQGQGQELSDNPVIGTWVVFSDAFTSSGAILQLITFQPGGILDVQFAFGRTGSAAGTWTMDTNSTVRYDYTSLLQAEHIDADFSYGDPVLPLGVRYSGSFRLSDDQQSWEDEQSTGTVLAADQNGNPIRLSESDAEATDPSSDVILRSPERLTSLINRSPEMTAEQKEWLNNGQAADPSVGLGVTTPRPSTPPAQVTVTPIPTTSIPVPTAAVEQQATISAQATMTAEAAFPSVIDSTDELPTATATTQPTPTEQVTVTPIATLAP